MFVPNTVNTLSTRWGHSYSHASEPLMAGDTRGHVQCRHFRMKLIDVGMVTWMMKLRKLCIRHRTLIYGVYHADALLQSLAEFYIQFLVAG